MLHLIKERKDNGHLNHQPQKQCKSHFIVATVIKFKMLDFYLFFYRISHQCLVNFSLIDHGNEP